MGRQQYCFFFDTINQLNACLKVAEEHNTCLDENLVGEPLELFNIFEMREPYKHSTIHGGKGNKCLLFLNGGGRSSTFDFFFQHGMHVYPYASAMTSRIGPLMCGPFEANHRAISLTELMSRAFFIFIFLVFSTEKKY